MCFRIDDAINTQKQIKAAAFIECSSKTGENVEDVFLRATRIIQAGAQSDKKTSCVDLTAIKDSCVIQ